MAAYQPIGLPKLAGRLTAELILRAPQEMNAVKEYEIDLRGNKIAAIENLGVTQNQFVCIDLSDNEIVKLEGFPRLNRVETLLLNNNRIARIGENLGASLPSLETLVLTGNRLASLTDIDNLASFKRLTSLSLLGNSVTKKPDYRLYAIHKLRHLKHLDFQKVKTKERQAAIKKFGAYVAEEAEASAPPAKKAKTFEPGEAVKAAEVPAEEAPAAKPTGPTQEQLTAIKIAIANAQTLEEVARLEKALKTGIMPTEDSERPKIDLMDEG
mmetsp:Transcript_5771/g.6631  ORF Transcript_5771/g.6631 Transcript_5771/m.6631 type:complete len:269 (-) Transcript_5771:537-1343(-)|eukprot:CAMPEP_0197848982 /NCGR_PEP_ID=MMETSP1438-20131217/10573_1 /TAXON_ID=1461541 /ORGANISM="Pterosperma sp., Strain CCMP1384" /LENGTH=268 /DNA_ID=CAMNT_0043461471 /DNA_START=273 /DNA_END=1079 /DNA_ORIENTATION=+